MKILRKSSENEMLIEFLKAEYDSERFTDQIKQALNSLGFDEKIITLPDLKNSAENIQRKRLMGKFRGYGLNKELFENFPSVSEYRLCSFSQDDMEKIRYIDYSYWNELSLGTHSPQTAAETIRRGIKIYGQDNDDFLQAAEYIKIGGKFPAMFFLTCDFELFIIAEGHLRMTAYALAPEYFSDVEAIVGKCSFDELNKWM